MMAISSYQRGIKAENSVKLWLENKGWILRFHRWRCPWGEIDLIMDRGSTLVGFEVKARPSFHRGAQSLTYRQQHRLCRSFEYFIAHHESEFSYQTFRLDYVVVVPSGALYHYVNITPFL